MTRKERIDMVLAKIPEDKREAFVAQIREAKDREEKAKNPRMQQVRIATEQAKTILQNQGVPCVFELNPGGHFQDVLPRQRRAVLSLL